jgi:phosphonate transport system permease protein
MDNLSQVRRLFLSTLMIVALIFVYVNAYRVTQINFGRLIADAPKAETFVAAFLKPDLFRRDTQAVTIATSFPIPCGSAPEVIPAQSGPRLVTNVPCADVKGLFTLEAFDLSPNSDISIRWHLPDDRLMTVKSAKTDAAGYFKAELDAKQVAASQDGAASQIEVDTLTPVGGLKPSQALTEVTDKLLVTIFMALFSTTIATIVAAPLSFLAASNITRRGCIGTATYHISRSFFNLIRSFDPLVMATVTGIWLGGGEMSGVLALTVVTTASLGKLFSEAVENIDLGPIEALQATGANRLQTIVFSVIPQIVPDFVSYIVYHWDINVRISTIIGFIGGGGIGFWLNERLNLLQYPQAAVGILGIIIVVMAMDFLSAEVRKKLT